jgi:hypothetical protein
MAGLALMLATAGGCGTDPTRTGTRAGAAREDPWQAAGVAHPQLTSHLDNGHTVVEVQAFTVLPISDNSDGNGATGFGERVAKIVWRRHRGRLDVWT